MSSKNADKVNIEDLRKILCNKKKGEFNYPKEYVLNFWIFMTCEYCGKFFFTSKISLFGDYLVCLCPRCGGRHAITINTVGLYRRLKLFTLSVIIMILLAPLIFRLVFTVLM